MIGRIRRRGCWYCISKYLVTDVPASKLGRCSVEHRHTVLQIFVAVANFPQRKLIISRYKVVRESTYDALPGNGRLSLGVLRRFLFGISNIN